MRNLFLLSILFIIYSCEKTSDKIIEEETFKNNSPFNNTAIITGTAIGDNSESIESIWKVGEVLIDTQSNNFRVDTIYITRSSPDYIYWIMPINNISENAYAFIQATGLQFLDNNDNIVYESEINNTFVHGSCGNSATSNIITSTFLRPTETGYFLGIEKVPFEQVDKIRLSSIVYIDSEFLYSPIIVIPTSYSVSNDNIYVNIENQSKETVYVSFSPYILLDNSNVPLYWGFLEPDVDMAASEKIVQSNSTATITGYDIYKGRGNRLKPILNFSLESYSSKSLDFKSTLTENKEDLFIGIIKQRDLMNSRFMDLY